MQSELFESKCVLFFRLKFQEKCFSGMSELLFECYNAPKVNYVVDGLASMFYQKEVTNCSGDFFFEGAGGGLA